MNRLSLLKLIDEYGVLRRKGVKDSGGVYSKKMERMRDLKLEIRAEIARLYLLDVAASEVSLERKDDIVEGDGENVTEWMNVRDDIDDAEIKMVGICRQIGAFHTQDKIRHICIKLQNIVFKHFGMGD
jgi:hypothetical protein